MLSDNLNVNRKIVDCLLFTRRILLAESNHQYLQGNLEEKESTPYNYMETLPLSFPLVKTSLFRKVFSIMCQSDFNEYKISCPGSFHQKFYQLLTISSERA